MDLSVGNLSLTSSQLASNFYINSNNGKPQENLIVSTLGITSLLTMIHLSSWNSSSVNLKECLNSDLQKILDFALLKEYLESIKVKNQSHDLRQKIFVFHSDNITINEYYSQLICTTFQASFIPINFADTNASTVINNHIGHFSGRKATHFVQNGTLSADMKLAIFNGIYFKGKWEHKFLKKYTKLHEFHISNNETVPVNMMFVRDKFCVKDDDRLEYNSIKIPYVGKYQDMYIILPTKTDGLFDLERKLSPEFIQSIFSDVNCQEKLTEFFLPKFKLETNLDMDMIHSVFQNWTDQFSEETKMTEMWHQATIDVTEDGTEAVATSGAIRGLMAPETIRFLTDHPFLFLIVDRRFKTVIFIGRVVNPNK